MKITVEQVSNGYVVYSEEGEISVFQANDFDEFGELDAAQQMLYALIEEFGLYGSKHDKKRLRVEVVSQGEEGGE